MSFEKLEKLSRSHSVTAVPFPAIIINTGKINSSLNSNFVRAIDKKKGDTVAVDIFYDKKNKKFGIKVHDEGDWVKKVTTSNQIQLWLVQFFSGHGIFLDGYYIKGEKKHPGKKIICELEYNEKKKLWIFEIPKEYYIKEKVLKKKKKKDKKDDKRTESK